MGGLLPARNTAHFTWVHGHTIARECIMRSFYDVIVHSWWSSTVLLLFDKEMWFTNRSCTISPVMLCTRTRHSIGHPMYKCVCGQCQLCWDDQEMGMVHWLFMDVLLRKQYSYKVLHMKYHKLYISINNCVVFPLFTTRLLEPMFVDPLVLGVFQS